MLLFILSEFQTDHVFENAKTNLWLKLVISKLNRVFLYLNIILVIFKYFTVNSIWVVI